MCKIAVIKNIRAGLEDKAIRFAETLTPLLTANDKDGFGYMALGDKGLFGERWLSPKDAWKNRNTYSAEEAAMLDAYGGTLDIPGAYNQFGKATKRIYTMCLHARMSTCGIGIENTHPFISSDGNTGLIHNGVITNVGEYRARETSSCDSEVILNDYVDKNVANVPTRIDTVSGGLAGWFACAVLAKSEGGDWYLDLFRDAKAPLFGVYVKQLETLVFCTAPYMVYKACKKLKWTAGKTYTMLDCSFVRHNALTGEVLNTYTIKTRPVQTSYLETWHGNKAPRYLPSELSEGTDIPSYRDDYPYNDDGPLDDDDTLPFPVDRMIKDPFYYKS